MSIQKIREDVLSLRGADVRIFGQPTTLSKDVPEGTVDIMEVLDILEKYEVTSMPMLRPSDDDEEEYDEVEAETTEEYMDYLEEMGDIDVNKSKSDNSYNWSGNVSQDFYFHIYHDMSMDRYLVEFAVHRFGDVRGNYTEEALLEFRYEEEFLEALLEATTTVELEGGYEARIEVISEGIEICDSESYEYVDTIYDLDDFDPSKYQSEAVGE
jgi:hypothetical protein